VNLLQPVKARNIPWIAAKKRLEDQHDTSKAGKQKIRKVKFIQQKITGPDKTASQSLLKSGQFL